MSNKTRKGIRPGFLAAALGVVAMLAILTAVALPSGSAYAQANPFAPPAPVDVEAEAVNATQVSVTWTAGTGVIPVEGYEVQRKTGDGDFDDDIVAHPGTDPSYTDDSVSPGTTYTYRVRSNATFNSAWVESNSVTTPGGSTNGGGETPMGAVSISGWSSSGGGSETLAIVITEPSSLNIDDSIVLVLDDKFTVPDSIPTGAVFFREQGGPSGGARVNASVTIDEEDDDLTGEDSHTIRIYVPDMNPADDRAHGVTSAPFSIVIDKAAGIKNPTEGEKTYDVGYQLLTGTAGYESDGTQMFANDGSASLGTLEDSKVAVRAKVSLDDKNNKRGYMLTVTGSGFNKGSSATAYVLKGQSADATPMCATVIDDGESIGSGTVGDNHKIVIEAEVTGGSKGDFSPGKTNYICVRDDNAPTRRISSAAKQFELQHSIAAEPADVASGEEVTVKLRDYPSGATVTSISLDGKRTLTPGSSATTTTFERDGSDLTFEMPGGVSGTVEISVTAEGASNKDTTITVNPSSLDLSQTEVAPNASVIISGSGFNEGKLIAVENITIDDERLVVDDAGTVSCAADVSESRECVQVTSSGEFTATVRVWTHSSSPANPALDDDEFTIKVKDEDGFEGKAKITIKSATIKVTPETASPRDFIVISGENWPISTPELDNSVTIEVDKRSRQADVDSTGRFRYEYQLRANIGIGDEHDIKVSYKDPQTVEGSARDDIEEEITFSVVEADISVTPAAAAPGQTISVSIGGMRPYTLIDEIRIGRVSLLGNQSVTTDREGDATVADITVPYLDPGHYPVTVQVGNDTRVVEFEMLAEAAVTGVAADIPTATSGLGDNLEAIFHFNNTSKEWTFYDPRPEFADLNTLTELNGGQPYWVLVKDSQEDVDWNGRLVNFTCAADDCWNLEIW